MSYNKFYVPILKWKRGEQIALQNLDENIKQKIMPVIEIVPIPWDYTNDQYSRTIDEHISNIGTQIVSCFSNRPVFLDLLLIEDHTTTIDGVHPLIFILEDARSKNLNVIPVVGCNRTPEYLNALKLALRNKIVNEICIRLEDSNFDDVTDNLIQLLSDLNISPQQTHLIIDFKYISPHDQAVVLLGIPTILNSVPQLKNWISLTICATSFPETLSTLVPSNSTDFIPRAEWILWTKLVSKYSHDIERIPQFGDYSIANPILMDFDPRFMDMSGNIRYTTGNSFFIARGGSVKKQGFVQMKNLCELVKSRPEFSGENFSWGDKYISDCAIGNCSTGNAETWRRVGTNHHLTYVVNQLSNFSYF